MTDHKTPRRDPFCPLCDVRQELHDGPGTCHIAAQKEFIIALPFTLNGDAR